MILGDNFFYGQSLSDTLKKCTKLNRGAKILLHKVYKPELFGVAKIKKEQKNYNYKENLKNICQIRRLQVYIF